jgi:UDP-glucose 4-epimerase
MIVLITGGAGYIGSVTAELLRSGGTSIVILDDLVQGHRSAVDEDVPFYLGKTGDAELVKAIIEAHKIDACIHFAAFASVGDSSKMPAKYFENNALQSVRLLDTLLEFGVDRFVFSSTCATYGHPIHLPIDEAHPQWPKSPYGWSKFMVERVLEAYQMAYGLRFVSLRYFNAAGATVNLGEHHEPEMHLIPNALRAATGEIDHVSIFGDDYDTPDGTCVRDYIHVRDLADAHVRALNYLAVGGKSTHMNLGNGTGFSVFEIIEAVRKITGKKINVKIEGRREGDPPQLIADSTHAFETLGWKPQFSEIENIIRSAWEWKQANPKGYNS